MDITELSSALSLIPGLFNAWYYMQIIPYSPIAYFMVCLIGIIHHGYAAIYTKNIILLRFQMLFQNIACGITVIYTTYGQTGLNIICFLAGCSYCLDLRYRKQLYVAYGLNAMMTFIATGYNPPILLNWIKILLVFMLAVKHHMPIFEIAFHMMTHNNIVQLWNTF